MPVLFRLFERDGPLLVFLLYNRLLCCSMQMSPSSLSRVWIKLARITILTGLQHRLQVTYQLLLVLAASYLVCSLSGRTAKSGGTADGVVSGIDLQSLFHYVLLKNISAILYDENQPPSPRTGIAFYLVCATLRTSNVGVSTLYYGIQINI